MFSHLNQPTFGFKGNVVVFLVVVLLLLLLLLLLLFGTDRTSVLQEISEIDQTGIRSSKGNTFGLPKVLLLLM